MLPAYREMGDADAMCRFGVAYDNGNGVEKNAEKAVEWYLRAVERGSVRAMYHLGLSYKNGDGVEKSGSDAVEWFRRAAEKGDADAMHGDGVDKSPEMRRNGFRMLLQKDMSTRCGILVGATKTELA